MAKGVLIPLSKRVVMCLWKQSIKENNLIKFSWLNRSCAGKDGILHQVMTKWRGNVVGQVRCGVRKPSRELHYQDASCDNFCGWSSQFLHCILGCSKNLGMLREGRRAMECWHLQISWSQAWEGLWEILVNEEKAGEWNLTPTAVKATSIRGKALCASCTAQNMDSVSIASETSLLWSL